MKQPLGLAALAFAAGIALADTVGVAVEGVFALTVLAGLWVWSKWGNHRAALPLLAGLSGAAVHGLQTGIFAPDDLRRVTPLAPVLATFAGTLEAASESQVVHGTRGDFTNSWGIVQGTALAVNDGESRSVTGRVLVTWPGALDPPLPAGTMLEVRGVLRPFPGPEAPGLFDPAEYRRRQGIYRELRTTSANDWQILSVAGAGERHRGVGAWLETGRFQRWGQTVLARGLPVIDEEVQLLWAMTLGCRNTMTPETQQAFLRSGTMHVFAISGLHIALICWLAVQLLRCVGVSRLWAGLFAAPWVWLYVAATGWQPSAVRSAIMSSVIIAGWTFRRPTDLLNSLAASALVILGLDSQQLFQPGFQLSFVVVGVIGWLAASAESFLRRWGRGDPFLPDELTPRWRRWAREVWWHLAGNLGLSAVAWLGSTPLTAWHFHLVSPVSLLANLVVVPLSSLALASTLASLACGALSPWLELPLELFNYSAWFWMHGMLVVSRACARWSWGSWHVAAPPLASLFLWYAVVFGIGSEAWRERKRRWVLGAASLLGCGLQFVVVQREREVWRLVVLPLRGGHAVWSAYRGESLLVDTGDASRAARITIPFVQALGYDAVDAVVLTHGDAQHVGGADVFAAAVEARQIIASPCRSRSPLYRRVLETFAAQSPTRLRRMAAGAGAASWTILYPAAEDLPARADDACVVLYREALGTRVLLLGDLSAAGQGLLLTRHPELRAEVVIAGVGERGALPGAEFLTRLKPREVIIADAALPATARARDPGRSQVRQGPWRTYFTSETGALELAGRSDGWELRDSRGVGVGEPSRQPTPVKPEDEAYPQEW